MFKLSYNGAHHLIVDSNRVVQEMTEQFFNEFLESCMPKGPEINALRCLDVQMLLPTTLTMLKDVNE